MIIGLGSFASYAQLSGSVSVEGEYQPIIEETERLTTFPAGYRFDLPASILDYDYSGMVTDFRPNLLTMGVTGRQTQWPWQKRRGFVDFRMGSYLNTRLHAGYYILSDSVNTLLADLNYEMSTLYREHGVPESFSRPARKRLYDGKLGLHYSRLLGQEGLLSADLNYRAAYFNYYGTTIEKSLLPSIGHDIKSPSQTLNQVKAQVAYTSSPSTVKGWHAEGSVDFLGYRRLYAPVLSGESVSGERETQLNIGGGYAFNFADVNAVSIDATGDFLFYSKPKESLSALSLPLESRNYGIVSLTPSYRLATDALSIRAGVDLAVGYKLMGIEPDDAKFYAAPDIDIQYRSHVGVGLQLNVTGGVTPSTLQLREEFDRYQMPFLLWNQPVYSPVDARIGLNVGPFAGFSAQAGVRYVVARNTPIGGWYQQLLGAWPVAPETVVNYSLTTPHRQTVNLSGLGVDLNLRYSYGTLLELAFDGSYVPQNGTEGIFNGFDRPRWILTAKGVVKPIKKLKIEVGYDYRGVRRCYAWGMQTLPGIDPDLNAYRLSDITDLNARISFSILPNLDIYCRGDNLLNRRVDILPGLQSEGIVISGGFYWEF